MSEVVYYTIGCPKCETLRRLMDIKNITYSTIDNKDEVLKIADKNGITQAPFALIDGQCFDTKQLQKWITERD